MGLPAHKIKAIIYNMDPEERSRFMALQKQIINIETKLMFERDKNTKLQLRNELQELEQQRRKVLNAYA